MSQVVSHLKSMVVCQLIYQGQVESLSLIISQWMSPVVSQLICQVLSQLTSQVVS